MASYGKRPIWQWILIYVVIGAIVYGAVYYFFLANKGGYGSNSQPSYGTSTQQTAPQTAPQAAPPAGGNGY